LSLLVALIIREIGVTTKKKMAPIITGEIILPIEKPNLIQSLFNGVKLSELKIVNNINIIEIKRDQYLTSLPDNNGQIDIIKKKLKKKTPKTILGLVFLNI
tara:strand:- start:92 stop:394 length:303 start_codon:yes stop_codon:yes gene_type:complete